MANTTYTAAVIVEVETSGVDEGTRKLIESGKVTEEVGKKYDKLGKKIEGAGDELRDFPKPDEIKPPKPEVESTFVSLRKRVKEAKEEVQRLLAEGFDPFSKEVLAAQRNAGELEDQLGDLNRQVSLLGDDNKLKAVSNLGTAIGSAFGVATGALQLFGAESEEAREIAQKFQGALNIVQGLGTITALKETFADLRVVLGLTSAAQTTMNTATGAGAAAQGTLTAATVGTTGATNAASGAMRGFAASLSATGIGAIVVALGALVGYLLLSKDATEKDTEAQKKNNDARAKAIDELNKEAELLEVRRSLLDKGEGAARRELELAKARGAQGKELFAAEQKVREEELAALIRLKAFKGDDFKDEQERLKLEEDIKNKRNEIVASSISFEREKREENVKNAKQSAKEKADAELKALQDGQAAIDAFQASQAGLQSQFERELQTQLAGIQSQANLRKLRNEVTYFDKREQLAEVNLLEDIQAAEDRITKLEEFGKTETDEYQQALAQRDKLNKEYQALIVKNAKDSADKQADIDKETTDKIKQQQQERRDFAIAAAQESFDFLFQLNRQSFDQQTADLEQQREQGIIGEEQYQEKLRAIKRKQARADKEAAIFQATLDFANALIKATNAPFATIPFNLKLAALVAGANLAKIIAAPIPKFKRGTLSVPGLDGGQDSVMAMLRPGEAVIPTETNRAYAPAIAAIYRKQIKPSDINAFVLSRLSGKAGLGREAALTASVDTFALGKALSRNKGVEVTNAGLVGKAIATELTRTYNPRRA